MGLASALAVWRLWSHRHRQQPAAEPAPDPAGELRRKLEETREDEAQVAEEPVVDESLEERRARVHAKAQEAIDAMHEGDAT